MAACDSWVPVFRRTPGGPCARPTRAKSSAPPIELAESEVMWKGETMRCLFVGASIALLAVVAGCSAPTSTVHGTVLFQGKPLSGGSIIFFAPNQQTFAAHIQSDGSYQIASVPRGHILVA